MNHRSRSFVLACASLLAACGTSKGEPHPAPTPDAGMGGSGGTGGAPDAGPVCAVGQAPGEDGACQPIGIQGCASQFVDEDGVCRPAMARCSKEPGTIPRFDQGCVHVGIQGCAPIFLGADALCHPRMSKCPQGTFAVPLKGCVPVDGPAGCGGGTWGAIEDAPGTVYVDPSSPVANGDGSKAKPITTIAGALALVPAGGTIALGAGTYAEGVAIDKALTLEGRCPSMVRITGTLKGNPNDIVVWVNKAAAVTLRGVEIAGAGIGVLAVDAPGLLLDRVHLRGAAAAGVRALSSIPGATLTLKSSWIEDTGPDAMQKFGRGIDVGDAMSLLIQDSAVTGSRTGGVSLFDPGTHAQLTDVLVEGTLPQPSDSLFGRGLDVNLGATAVVESSAFVENHESGVFVYQAQSSLTMSDSLIEGTLPQPTDGKFGVGVNVQVGGSAELTHNAILGNSFRGVLAFSNDANGTSTVKTSGNLIAKTASPGALRAGIGVMIQGNSQGLLLDDAIVGNHAAGLFMYFGGSTVEATRVLIENTLPLPMSGTDGAGALSFLSSGSMSLSSCALLDNTVAAVGVAATKGKVLNCLLRGTKPGSFTDPGGTTHEDFGDGLVAALGAEVTIERTLVEATARAGILFDASKGAILGCESTTNAYGLVLQGTPRPDYAPAKSSFHGNSKEDFLMDGDLPIPSQQSLLP